MKRILLTQGKYALVDNEKYNLVAEHKWTYSHGYAYRNEREGETIKRVYMHRVVFGEVEEGLVVDHINGNSLDNRVENLRAVTHQENIRNSKIPSNNTSGYKGVTWDKGKRKWLAHTTINRRFKYLGRFNCKHAAGLFYNERVTKMFGDTPRLNQVEECACDECDSIRRDAS